MSLSCALCDRDFTSYSALQAHNDTTSQHPRCTRCERNFTSEKALQDHIANSSAHEDTYCSSCERDFVSAHALRQHFTSSSVHEDTYCAHCDEDFVDSEARREHLADSSEHHYCVQCEREFVHATALEQHFASSNAHNYCVQCERHFSTPAALQEHRRYAGVHRNSDVSDPESDSDSGSDDHDWVAPPIDYMTVFLRNMQLQQPAVSTVGSLEPYSGVLNTEGSTSAPMPARNTLDFVDSGNSGYRCPLCLDRSEELSSVKCGHVFCTRCICLALSERRQCPLCRVSAEFTDLRRIFFNS